MVKGAMKVVHYSAQGIETSYLERNPEIFASIELSFVTRRLSLETVELARGAYAVCVFVNDVLDHSVLEALHKLGIRLVLLRCAGFNNVDQVAAEEFGITIMRVPAYSPYAVAEFAVTLLLGLYRRLVKAANRTREHDFSLHEGLIGSDIHGKVVGIIGTGKIGRIMAAIMKGFGCTVLAYDVYPNDETRNMGVEYLPLDDVLARADILSLHCPLMESTKHIIDEKAVAKMKRGVVLINTSRGGLIKTSAVLSGLKSGQIGGLGMDVYENEGVMFFRDLSARVLEDDEFSQLQGMPNVLITPHLAFCTTEALSSIFKTTRTNLDTYVDAQKAKAAGTSSGTVLASVEKTPLPNQVVL